MSSAASVKKLAGQINVIIHAAGILCPALKGGLKGGLFGMLGGVAGDLLEDYLNKTRDPNCDCH